MPGAKCVTQETRHLFQIDRTSFFPAPQGGEILPGCAEPPWGGVVGRGGDRIMGKHVCAAGCTCYVPICKMGHSQPLRPSGGHRDDRRQHTTCSSESNFSARTGFLRSYSWNKQHPHTCPLYFPVYRAPLRQSRAQRPVCRRGDRLWETGSSSQGHPGLK